MTETMRKMVEMRDYPAGGMVEHAISQNKPIGEVLRVDSDSYRLAQTLLERDLLKTAGQRLPSRISSGQRRRPTAPFKETGFWDINPAWDGAIPWEHPEPDILEMFGGQSAPAVRWGHRPTHTAPAMRSVDMRRVTWPGCRDAPWTVTAMLCFAGSAKADLVLYELKEWLRSEGLHELDVSAAAQQERRPTTSTDAAQPMRSVTKTRGGDRYSAYQWQVRAILRFTAEAEAEDAHSKLMGWLRSEGLDEKATAADHAASVAGPGAPDRVAPLY